MSAEHPELFSVNNSFCFPQRFYFLSEALLAALWIILPIFLIYGCAGEMHKVASVLCTLWEQPKIAPKLNWLTIILDSIKLKHIAHILHNKPQLFHGSN